jgi:hypothetical protein
MLKILMLYHFTQLWNGKPKTWQKLHKRRNFAFSRVGWQKSISDRKYAVGAVTHKQKEAAWQKLTASHHQDADRKISIICLFYLNEI